MKKLILLLLIVLIPLVMLAAFDNYFSDRSKAYIEKEVVTTLSNTLTNALEKPINENLFSKDLFFYQYDKNNVIKGIYINSDVINQILISVNRQIKKEIDQKNLEKMITQVEIPLGSLISKSVLANVGPQIKIKVMPISFYKTDIITNMKSYGINNALFELYLKVDMEVDTIIPLRKDEINFTTNILLASQIIQGEIPYYYYSGNGTIEALPH